MSAEPAQPKTSRVNSPNGEADPARPKTPSIKSPKRAVTDYLDARPPTSDDPSVVPEAPDKAEVRRSLVEAVATIVGDAGICAKADTQDGSPVLVAAREGALWIVSHVAVVGDERQLGSVEARRLGNLPSAEIVQKFPLQAGDRKMIELRHERLPSGSLSFDTSRLRGDTAHELVAELEKVAG
jgi:hypothetical protein